MTCNKKTSHAKPQSRKDDGRTSRIHSSPCRVSLCVFAALREMSSVFVLLLAASGAFAAEVTTNGVGGGAWSDPATWKGNAVPKPEDDAVIRKGDIVVFDRNDDGKVTCQKLFLDPRGALRFKTNAGKLVFCSAAGVESYGAITMDGTKAAADLLELRLVGDDAAKRKIELLKGASFQLRGKAGLPKDARNVALTSPDPKDPKADPVAGALNAAAGTTLDLEHADLHNVKVTASDIDSTGSKPGEKVAIVGNRFTGLARLYCARCDTATVTGNSFEHPDPKRREGQALVVSDSPLAEVKGNHVRGGFEHGLFVTHGPDSAVHGNTAENCTTGIYLGFGVNHAATRNTVRNCDFGFTLYYTPRATLEENTAVGCKTGLYAVHTTAQVTGQRYEKPPDGGVPVLVTSDANSRGQIVLLNCDLKPEQVKLALGEAKKAGTPPPVVSMAFLVVAVKNAPEGAAVEVKPGAGEKDELAVRNSPAALTKGLTPLPIPPGLAATLPPLIVRSWSLDADAKIDLPPVYSVRVLAPAEKPGAERKVLLTTTTSPGEKWYRAKADDSAPTIEVTVK